MQILPVNQNSLGGGGFSTRVLEQFRVPNVGIEGVSPHFMVTKCVNKTSVQQMCCHITAPGSMRV